MQHEDPKDDLSPFFERLSISLEVTASGSAPRNSGGQHASRETSPGRQEDVIWRGTLVAAEDPVIISARTQDEESSYKTTAVWEIKALLSIWILENGQGVLLMRHSGRPRIRLQSPMITFKAGAVLQPSADQIDRATSDPYLLSGIPQPENLLEPLKGSERSSAEGPSLSAARLSRVTPVSDDARTQVQPLKVSVPGAFRALPAISSRVRYHKSNSPGSRASLVASLDMEMAPFSTDDIEITSVDLHISGGSAIDLGQGLIPKLPLRCRSRDNIVFLYRLALDNIFEDSAPGMTRNLDITINATVLTTDQCRPHIQMHWKTGVDFTTTLNPVYGAPGQSMQRSNRPPNLAVSGTSASVTNNSNSSQDGPRGRQRAVSVSDLGVTITFTAPSRVYVREPFNWDVLVLNGSNKTQRLALVAIPRLSRRERNEHGGADISSSAATRKHSDVGDAVVDENLLYTMQKTALADPTDVISLSANVEIRYNECTVYLLQQLLMSP